MTLIAEALAARKANLKRFSEIEARVIAAAVSYKGETPEDNASELLDEMNKLADEFEAVSVRINRMNNGVAFRFDGREMTLMEGVAFRENLLLRHRALKRIAEGIDTATGRRGYGYQRRTKDDLKQVVHLEPSDVRKESDKIAEQLERLNIAMQAMNWTTVMEY